MQSEWLVIASNDGHFNGVRGNLKESSCELLLAPLALHANMFLDIPWVSR